MRRPTPFSWFALVVLGLLPESAATRAFADDPPAGPVPSTPAAPPADEEEDDPERGRVGFGYVVSQGLKPDERKKLDLTAETGVFVRGVVQNSPAQKVGLMPNDELVKYNGRAIPPVEFQATDTDEKKKEGEKKFSKAFAALGKAIKPGDKVEIVVKRAGKELRLEAVAVSKAVLDEESMFDTIPEFDSAGPAAAATFDFQTLPEGADRPAGFLTFVGAWEVTEDPLSAENQVFVQRSVAEPWALCLATGAGRCYADGKASVRFQIAAPQAGQEDAAAGIAFRAKDRKNYYLVRANGLENNFRLYVMKDGLRADLASVEVPLAKPESWHTIDLEFSGTKLKATLDGKWTVEAEDGSYARGWTGLWTKKDSSTYFDDLKLEPIAAK